MEGRDVHVHVCVHKLWLDGGGKHSECVQQRLFSNGLSDFTEIACIFVFLWSYVHCTSAYVVKISLNGIKSSLLDNLHASVGLQCCTVCFNSQYITQVWGGQDLA